MNRRSFALASVALAVTSLMPQVGAAQPSRGWTWSRPVLRPKSRWTYSYLAPEAGSDVERLVVCCFDKFANGERSVAFAAGHEIFPISDLPNDLVSVDDLAAILKQVKDRSRHQAHIRLA